jgi:hypothetical protein
MACGLANLDAQLQREQHVIASPDGVNSQPEQETLDHQSHYGTHSFVTFGESLPKTTKQVRYVAFTSPPFMDTQGVIRAMQCGNGADTFQVQYLPGHADQHGSVIVQNPSASEAMNVRVNHVNQFFVTPKEEALTCATVKVVEPFRFQAPSALCAVASCVGAGMTPLMAWDDHAEEANSHRAASRVEGLPHKAVAQIANLHPKVPPEHQGDHHSTLSSIGNMFSSFGRGLWGGIKKAATAAWDHREQIANGVAGVVSALEPEVAPQAAQAAMTFDSVTAPSLMSVPSSFQASVNQMQLMPPPSYGGSLRVLRNSQGPRPRVYEIP